MAEVVLFVVCFLSAWPFGSIDPPWEFRLASGVALLSGLWAAYSLATRKFRFRIDLPTIVLGGLLALTIVQLLPLPLGWVRVLSPTAARLHEFLTPATLEHFPGEAPTARASSIPLSVHPEATRGFAVRIAALMLVYMAVRNWLATRDSLKRMAWGGLVVGSALSLFAIGQRFSAPSTTLYWVFPSPGEVFGPFINRNHYVDYIALCMGWTLALLLVSKNQGGGKPNDYASGAFDFLAKPVPLAATFGLGLMALSVLFSLSRGGTLAVFLAALGVWFGLLDSRMRRTSRLFVLLFAASVGGGALYFGLAPIENRIHSTRNANAPDDRIPLWRGALSQVPGFAVLGSGNGSFSRVEPLARPQIDLAYVEYTNAHNEYVEALLEGGLARLALTAALVFAAVVQLGRAYRRRSERVVGPYLLGIWFGLFVLAAHAVTDFGIHMPAVAVLATATLAFGMAAARNPEFGVHRKRHRKHHGGDVPAPAKVVSEPKEKPEIEVRGIAAAALALLLGAAGAVIALDLRNYCRFYDYWLAGKYINRPREASQVERKIALLKDAAALRPMDSTGQLELGKARVQGARDLSLFPLMAVVGPGFPFTGNDFLDSPEFRERLRPGLMDLRRARNLCPLFPETHLLLGQHAGAFDGGEPPLVHFERAKFLNKVDPNIWFACGVAHLESGNRAAAAENWRRSLELSSRQLVPILALGRSRFGMEETLARILPENPATLMEAARLCTDDPTIRRAILERAAAAPEASTWTWQQRVAVAEAADALGRPAEAEAHWNRAMAADPQQFEVRNGYGLFLEREERYEEALVQLNWLIKARPSDTQLRDRALFVRHGIDLNEQLKR
jgi:O-antigen ligase/Flp pilus assembly protein TadD